MSVTPGAPRCRRCRRRSDIANIAPWSDLYACLARDRPSDLATGQRRRDDMRRRGRGKGTPCAEARDESPSPVKSACGVQWKRDRLCHISGPATKNKSADEQDPSPHSVVVTRWTSTGCCSTSPPRSSSRPFASGGRCSRGGRVGDGGVGVEIACRWVAGEALRKDCRVNPPQRNTNRARGRCGLHVGHW